MVDKKVLLAIFDIIGIILIALGAGFGWGLFPSVVEEEISKSVALVEGSEAWNAWVELPIVLQFKVYFFQVTNIDGMLNNNEKPKLEEKGPYVYDLYKSKYDITLHDDGKEASYFQDQKLYFNKTLSGNLLEDDPITLLNPVIMGAILLADQQLQKENDLGDRALTLVAEALPYVFPNANTVFETYTVDQLLFKGVPMKCAGSETVIAWGLFCTAIEAASKTSLTFRPDPDSVGDYLFSLLYPKNTTHDGRYRVDTGTVDPKMLGNVVQWNYSSTLNWWGGEKCNEIKGTDAAIFPPFLTREKNVDIFATDLCRSVYAVYQKDIEYKGIPAYRYVADDIQLGTAQDYPENYCWCSEKSGCVKSGSLDIYSCLDAPMVLSFPHFYMADEDYINGVEGLNPTLEKHEMYLDIEPYSGIPVAGGKRIQFNMMIKEVRNNPLTTNLPSALLPFIWFDEGVELDDANSELLKTELIDVLVVLNAVRWTLLSVGIVAIIAATAVFFLYKPKHKISEE